MGETLSRSAGRREEKARRRLGRTGRAQPRPVRARGLDRTGRHAGHPGTRAFPEALGRGRLRPAAAGPAGHLFLPRGRAALPVVAAVTARKRPAMLPALLLAGLAPAHAAFRYFD